MERNTLLLAGFNLVAGLVITALLVLNVKNTPYPPAVGIALALLVGGSLTSVTVWVSLRFGSGGPREDSCAGKDRRDRNRRRGRHGRKEQA